MLVVKTKLCFIFIYFFCCSKYLLVYILVYLLSVIMSKRNCCVVGCSNGGYRLNIWRSKICVVHSSNYEKFPCVCKPPFQLYPFPSEDEVDKRQVWIKSVNRKDPKNPLKKLASQFWLQNMFKSFCWQYSYFEKSISNIESRPFTNSECSQKTP